MQKLLTVDLNIGLSSTVLKVGPFWACISTGCWITITATEHRANAFSASLKEVRLRAQLRGDVAQGGAPPFATPGSSVTIKVFAAFQSNLAQKGCLRENYKVIALSKDVHTL